MKMFYVPWSISEGIVGGRPDIIATPLVPRVDTKTATALSAETKPSHPAGDWQCRGRNPLKKAALGTWAIAIPT